MMPGTNMPPMSGFGEESDVLNDLIGIDEDEDGWDAFDELITDHVDNEPDDKPTQEEVDVAMERFDEIGWEEFKETLTKNQDIINPSQGKTNLPKQPLGMQDLNDDTVVADPLTVLMDDLTGEDGDQDGWDAFDELISNHSDSNPDEKPTQEEVDAAYEKLDQLGWEEYKVTLTKNQDIINAPREKPNSITPQLEMPLGGPGMMPGMGFGMQPMGMPGMPGGQREPEPDEPSEEEIANLNRVDTYGNNLLHYISAIGSSQLIDLSDGIVDLPPAMKNKQGVTPDELEMAFTNSVDEDMFSFGANPMVGMYGMMGVPGGEPGNPVGMVPGMMNPYSMGMYGMGMPGMAFQFEEVPLNQPLPPEVLEDLWLTEDSATEKMEGLEMQASYENEDSSALAELIGIDEDGDGWDAYDEIITGHSDLDPNDSPAQEEVDEAWELESVDNDGDGRSALEEKLTGHSDDDASDTPDRDAINSLLGLDVPDADEFSFGGPGNGMEVLSEKPMEVRLTETLNQVSFFEPHDELELRRVTIERVIGENRQRSLFDRVTVGDFGAWQRLRLTGLIHHSTDPRTGFSTLKWMELLNYVGDPSYLANGSPQDGAFRRLQLRLSSAQTAGGGQTMLHWFIRTGDKYKVAFALAQTGDVDQRDERGRTALHVAAASGSLASVKVLLELGSDPTVGDDYGFNALHWAAQEGRMEVARHLVEQVGLKPVPDLLQRTPAALAKANGHAAVSEYLEAQ